MRGKLVELSFKNTIDGHVLAERAEEVGRGMLPGGRDCGHNIGSQAPISTPNAPSSMRHLFPMGVDMGTVHCLLGVALPPSLPPSPSSPPTHTVDNTHLPPTRFELETHALSLPLGPPRYRRGSKGQCGTPLIEPHKPSDQTAAGPKKLRTAVGRIVSTSSTPNARVLGATSHGTCGRPRTKDVSGKTSRSPGACAERRGAEKSS